MATDQRCRGCTHPDRESLDRELAGGITLRAAGEKYGLSKDSIARHKKNHLSKALRAVQERRELGGATTAVERAESLYSKASEILEEAQDNKLALSAIKELRETVVLLAKLSGELDERPQVQVLNVQASPEWLQIQSVMLEALAPFPDARMAVAGALESMGDTR